MAWGGRHKFNTSRSSFTMSHNCTNVQRTFTSFTKCVSSFLLTTDSAQPLVLTNEKYFSSREIFSTNLIIIIDENEPKNHKVKCEESIFFRFFGLHKRRWSDLLFLSRARTGIEINSWLLISLLALCFATHLTRPRALERDPFSLSSAVARRGDQPWCWYVSSLQKVWLNLSLVWLRRLRLPLAFSPPRNTRYKAEGQKQRKMNLKTEEMRIVLRKSASIVRALHKNHFFTLHLIILSRDSCTCELDAVCSHNN